MAARKHKTKLCKICGRTLRLCSRNFYKSKGGWYSYCKTCTKERKRKYQQEHLEQHNKHNKDRTANGSHAYSAIVYRCENPESKAYPLYGGKGVKCLITKEEFLEIFTQATVCQLCGCKLESGKGMKSKQTDRINSDGDYSIDNIRVVCKQCNIMFVSTKDKDFAFIMNKIKQRKENEE